MKTDSILFFSMLRDFLTVYLANTRSASPNTIKSYRDTLNILVDYMVMALNRPLASLSFSMISGQFVENFLEWLEKERHYSISSRNQRLAVLKSFFKFAGQREKTLMALYLDVSNIPAKSSNTVHQIEFFSEENLKAILDQPDTKKMNGRRDLFFMILMYDTGGRVQEILDLKPGDFHLNAEPPYVTLTGKGSRARNTPLMEKTCEHLEIYRNKFHASLNPDEHLFYINRGNKRSQMSVDCVEKFIGRYGMKAHEISPDAPEHLYPHMFRHSRAMHLYRNGMPLTLVSEWLGHASVNTTRQYYANADTTMKKEAIDKATLELNPLFSNDYDFDWEEDEELLKTLYSLR